MSPPRLVSCCLLFVAIGPQAVNASPPVWPVSIAIWTQAQPQAAPNAGNKSATEADSLKALIDRINKLEAEVDRLKNGQPGKVAAPASDHLALVDIAYLGTQHADNSTTRFVAFHLLVANLSASPLKLTQEQITCEIDGETKKLEAFPQGLGNLSFMYLNQSYPLNTMQPEKSRAVPAGGQTSFWVVFPKLPMSSMIPKCKLKLTLGESKKEIDVNAVQRAMLGLEVERIGPRGALALMTITGSLTHFNSQSLVDEIDKLIAQKVVRVVIRWSADAKPPENQVMSWLQTSNASMPQGRNFNDSFPPISGSLREFHLVKFSDKEPDNNFAFRTNQVRNQVHATPADAVSAALRTAYQGLPRDELLNEIREGHPLTRAAALSYGGGRLDVEHLPLIFQWVEDKDQDVQRAALQTLSHFGEAEAIDKLVYYVKRNIEPLSSTAIESLAGSRFGVAHEALLRMLGNEPPDSKRRIVQVLARFPRPVWSETLYEYARDPRAGLNLEAIKALVQVDHPRLVELLQAGLNSTDKPLRDFSFQTLADRPDEQSEKLAIEYTLNHLKTSPPDNKMTQLLSRTRDARAIPLLVQQLERSADRNSALTLLVQIGDQSVAEKLAEKYPALTASEKVVVLNGLRQFRHPKFRELAGAALLSGDGTLISNAATALMQEGHPEGEKLLIAALEKQTTAHLLASITNALGNFGTPTARAALIKAKESGDATKQTFAKQALLQIRNRQPSFQYYLQGRQRLASQTDVNDKQARLQQENDAIEFFDLALKLDATFAEAYAWRGKVYLRQNKMTKAGNDFEKALELTLEEDDSEVITGLAAARVADGRLDDAVKLVESNREKFKKDDRGLFLYNSACVYSRSVEYLREHKDVPDAEKKIEDYRKKSLTDLEASIKQGFRDFDWMAKDPDFQTLRDDSDFKKLLALKPAKTEDDDEEK